MWLVVGVSGVTCGGKSSLARALQKAFPGAVLVNQDDYFLPVDSPLHVRAPGLDHHNWEVLSSLDMERMEAAVKDIISQETACLRILIVEGFLIFNHEAMSKLCDRKYYLTLPREETWARRSARVYDPPDPPGYFDKCVWPEYECHRNQVLERVSDIVLLDGRKSLADTIQRVISDLLSTVDQATAGGDSL
ncbi:nicotinamide riboside kinase 1 [Bacillus rossius redtenbacheri]|uniref:nicotinamide riboside kinase 1 n=1 Tax=Bacillus rossius redtenbacheri TaxID=93214 RepID=UPI002FDECC26